MRKLFALRLLVVGATVGEAFTVAGMARVPAPLAGATAHALLLTPLPPFLPGACRQRAGFPTASESAATIESSPDAEACAALIDARPSQSLEPRNVILTLMHALHKKNLDTPSARFGCAVVLRFLAPENPASRATPQRFAEYLAQPWYLPLLEWSEFRWEGDTVLLSNGREAYQQLNVRSGEGGEWTNVRWILEKVGVDGSGEWRLESVFVQEPDSGFEYGGDDKGELSPLSSHKDKNHTPSTVVIEVMKALRNADEPYRHHGAEVAIRACSPTNAASRLSPQGFSQYLREPWYAILTEWDSITCEEEEGDEEGTVMVFASVKRDADNFFTIVNWQLSRYSGRWLTDSLTITEGTSADSILWTGEEYDEEDEDEYAAFAPDEDEAKRN